MVMIKVYLSKAKDNPYLIQHLGAWHTYLEIWCMGLHAYCIPGLKMIGFAVIMHELPWISEKYLLFLRWHLDKERQDCIGGHITTTFFCGNKNRLIDLLIYWFDTVLRRSLPAYVCTALLSSPLETCAVCWRMMAFSSSGFLLTVSAANTVNSFNFPFSVKWSTYHRDGC